MDISVMKSQGIAKWAYLCPFIYRRCGNSSAQDFAFTAKSVKTCKLSQKNLPLAEGDLKWTDSVTGKPKAELLLDAVVTVQEQLPKERELCYTVYESGPQGF